MLSVQRHLSIVYSRLTGSVHKAALRKIDYLTSSVFNFEVQSAIQTSLLRIELHENLYGNGSVLAQSGRSERNLRPQLG